MWHATQHWQTASERSVHWTASGCDASISQLPLSPSPPQQHLHSASLFLLLHLSLEVLKFFLIYAFNALDMQFCCCSNDRRRSSCSILHRCFDSPMEGWVLSVQGMLLLSCNIYNVLMLSKHNYTNATWKCKIMPRDKSRDQLPDKCQT